MTKTIRINGMSCGHCTAAVEKALLAVPGVTGAKADLASRSATVEIRGGVSEEALQKAVTDAGYEVTGVE